MPKLVSDAAANPASLGDDYNLDPLEEVEERYDSVQVCGMQVDDDEESAEADVMPASSPVRTYASASGSSIAAAKAPGTAAESSRFEQLPGDLMSAKDLPCVGVPSAQDAKYVRNATTVVGS